MIPRPRLAAGILALSLAVVGILVAAAPAEAASAYRYWTYWYANPSDASWTYGPVGPGGHAVDDGSVEGWRFVVAAPNPQAPQPRVSASSAFASICGKTARPAGKDRVAVVVDFGTAADAPPGEAPPAGVRGTCALVPNGSKGLAALSTAGYQPRLGSGLVCGLSGYPAHECGVVVQQPGPTPKPSPTKAKPTKSAAPAPSPTKSATRPAASKQPGQVGSANAAAQASTSSPQPSVTQSSPTPSSSGVVPPGVTPEPSDPGLAVGPAPPPAGGSSSGTPAGLLLGGALVFLIAAAAVLRTHTSARRDPA